MKSFLKIEQVSLRDGTIAIHKSPTHISNSGSETCEAGKCQSHVHHHELSFHIRPRNASFVHVLLNLVVLATNRVLL